MPACEHALRQLERQRLGRNPRLRESRADVLDQHSVAHLTSRDVHVHRERRRAGCLGSPRSGLAARLVEHPAAELHDLAGLLRERDERARLEEAAGGMRPANERLDSDDSSALEVDHGLVVEDELLVAARTPQLGDELQPADELLAHVRRVHDVLRLAGRLGPVHGDVGRSKQLVRHRSQRDARRSPSRRPRDPRRRRAPAGRPRVAPQCRRQLATPATSSMRMANSSPPSLATVWLGACASRRRAPTPRRSASPAT